MQGPLRATLSDFDSLIELVDICFSGDKDRGGMLARWPHCYMERPEKLRNSLIMKEGDQVVSHVGYADQTLLVEGGQLKVAGITGVATRPEYRRQGLMTRLLDHCIRLMEEEGYVLSDLGGDTQRYRKFGWENGGRRWSFHLTPRSVGACDPPTGWKVAKYEGSPEEIEFVKAIHEREPMRVERTDELYRLLLGRKGWQGWLAEGPDDARAYMVVQADDPKHLRAVEVGGDGVGVHGLADYLVREGGAESLGIGLPWRHPLNGTLFKLSTGWGVQTPRMFRINDLAGTLRGFLPQLRSRYEQLGTKDERTVSLAMSGTDQKVRLVFSKDDVTLETDHGRDALALDRFQMVRFLFGPGVPGTEFDLPSEARFLDLLLPLGFYLWALETV